MNSSEHATGTADPQQSTPRVYTVMQLAEILQIDPRTVRTKARAGTWPSLDFGPRTIRFTETHLDTIVAGSASPAVRAARPHRPRRRPS